VRFFEAKFKSLVIHGHYLRKTVLRSVSNQSKKNYKEMRRMKEKLKIEQTLSQKHRQELKLQTFLKKNMVYPYPININPGNKKDMSVDAPKTYCPKFVEPCWYAWWEKQKYFEPKGSGKVFSMVLPPPNVTGKLHMGHALTATIEDIMARWHRMHGYDVMWVPGSDHAGIATQVQVEKFIEREMGETKHSLGEEGFKKAIWEWKDKKGVEIFQQLRTIGSSLNWKQEQFTLSDDYNEAVIEAFVRLHDEGLIYRDEKMINWSPHMRTSLSDIEVDLVQQDRPFALHCPGYDNGVQFGVLHKVAYKLARPSSKHKEIVVATSRVETLFGDVAVAVHPDDPRYCDVIGQRIIHPFLPDRYMKVIADEMVDMNKGTGAVKITPSHDRLDFEIGQRHKLRKLEGVDSAGRLVVDEGCPLHESLHGVKQFEARHKILNTIKEMELYRGNQNYSASARQCSRTGDIIEPRIKKQWFVRVDELCKSSLDAVERGETSFVQSRFTKQWQSWLTNCEDWCLSRSLWWGHQIPAYKVTDNDTGDSKWLVACNEEEALKKNDYKNFTIEQETDVLDTWFSSALYPFVAMGWPKNTSKLERYYPLNVMETGHDLIFFWVARMMMLGTRLIGKAPFAQVLFHPMVCDDYGRKMSKSLGNVVDPMQVITGSSHQQRMEAIAEMCLSEDETNLAMMQMKDLECPPMGADALRMSLCLHSLNKDSVNFSLKDCERERKFLNKLFQSFNLVIKSTEDVSKIKEIANSENYEQKLIGNFRPMDKWINYKLLETIKECNKNIKNHQYSVYLSTLQHFWKSYFCDWYLQECKGRLRHETVDGRTYYRADDHAMAALQWNVAKVTETFLRLLHPVAPFVTEELRHRLPQDLVSMFYEEVPESVMIAPYPTGDDLQCQLASIEDKEMKSVDDFMRFVDGYRKITNMFSNRNEKIAFHVKSAEEYSNFKNQSDVIKVYMSLSLLSIELLGPNSDLNEVKSNYLSSTFDDSLTIYWLPKDFKDYILDDTVDKNLNKRLTRLNKILLHGAKDETPKEDSNEVSSKVHDDIIKHEIGMVEDVLDQRLKIKNGLKTKENPDNI